MYLNVQIAAWRQQCRLATATISDRNIDLLSIAPVTQSIVDMLATGTVL